MAIEHFKPTRTFDQQSNSYKQYQSVICGRCGEVANNPVTGRTPLPPEVVAKKMQHKGWVVGKKRKDDLCPACVAAAAHHNHKEPIKLTVVKSEAPKKAELTREERRIIFLAIEDHYISPTRGYAHDWNDKAIANDLSVPESVVTEIREQFFGPAEDTALVEAREALTKLSKRIEAHEAELASIKAEADRIATVIDGRAYER